MPGANAFGRPPRVRERFSPHLFTNLPPAEPDPVNMNDVNRSTGHTHTHTHTHTDREQNPRHTLTRQEHHMNGVNVLAADCEWMGRCERDRHPSPHLFANLPLAEPDPVNKKMNGVNVNSFCVCFLYEPSVNVFTAACQPPSS